tara:strand:+ start:46 stop:663 length:618 start_codon:yes stop_codon:yes gene_type:complete
MRQYYTFKTYNIYKINPDKKVKNLESYNLRRLANILTITRFFATIPILISLYFNNDSLVFALLIFSAATDVFDGWLSRKAGGGSKWGAIYDPLADKCVILGPLIWLCFEGIIPFWSLFVLLFRDITISLWRSKNTKGGQASSIGKAKSVLLFIGITLLFWPYNLGGELLIIKSQVLGLIFFWAGLFFAIISCLAYLKLLRLDYLD